MENRRFDTDEQTEGTDVEPVQRPPVLGRH